MDGFERVASMDTLYRWWQKISAKNATGGLDGIDLVLYCADLQKNLRSFQSSVTSGSYRPYTEKTYANHKDRNISFFCVDDKIIQTALSDCLLSTFAPAISTHGFIPKSSIFTAKKSLDTALSDGVIEYAKVDITAFMTALTR
jgi:hypothetical protein